MVLLAEAFDLHMRAIGITAVRWSAVDRQLYDGGLAERLRISPQAALALLKQLVAAGVLREATGRASWRAFVVA